MSISSPHALTRFRVIAIIAAFNEGDVIYHVIRDLIENDVSVYLIDNCSTDNTVEEASRLLGKGLLEIERYPKDETTSSSANREYAWQELLKRKEELASELDAEWFIHADADEFRESVWPGLKLAESIHLIDDLGYNAIQFQVLNFRPVTDNFIPGEDVRKYLTAYESPESFDALQIKAWKKREQRVDLASSGGHEVKFANRRVFPFRFLLRHYPIRNSRHGKKKVFVDRLPRFMEEERAMGWHVQYDEFQHNARFQWQAQKLCAYDALQLRAAVVERTHAQICDSLRPSNSLDANEPAELISQLHNSAAFLKLYNLGSALEKSGRRDEASRIFGTIADVLSILDPELAGKASYRLALLSGDSDRKVEYLRRCVLLYPDHKAGRVMLENLTK
jgi:hypothetical protein